MTADFTIRAMRADDWPAVRDICEAGIATGHATFETSALRCRLGPSTRRMQPADRRYEPGFPSESARGTVGHEQRLAQETVIDGA